MERDKDLDKHITLIDFNEKTQQWTAMCGDPECPNTGVFAWSEGPSPIEHDMVWVTAVKHEYHFHGGNGEMWHDVLLTVRPYPVPNPTHGAAS